MHKTKSAAFVLLPKIELRAARQADKCPFQDRKRGGFLPMLSQEISGGHFSCWLCHLCRLVGHISGPGGRGHFRCQNRGLPPGSSGHVLA